MGEGFYLKLGRQDRPFWIRSQSWEEEGEQHCRHQEAWRQERAWRVQGGEKEWQECRERGGKWNEMGDGREAKCQNKR